MVLRLRSILQFLDPLPLSAVDENAVEESYSGYRAIAKYDGPKSDDISVLSKAAPEAIKRIYASTSSVAIISLHHEKSDILEGAAENPNDDYLLQLCVETEVIFNPSNFESHINEAD